MRRIRLLVPLLLLTPHRGSRNPLRPLRDKGRRGIESRGRLIDSPSRPARRGGLPPINATAGRASPHGSGMIPSACRDSRVQAVQAETPTTCCWHSPASARHDTNENHPHRRFFVVKTATDSTAGPQHPRRWLDLPSQQRFSCLLFATSASPVRRHPRTVITQVRELHKRTSANPNLLILPDGSYLAACSSVSFQRNVDFYRSTDGVRLLKHGRGALSHQFYTVFPASGRST